MFFDKKRNVGITETVLRDGHQSLVATRMTTYQMLPIIEQMDKIGYHSVECWGGATFDTCLRYLNENPWVRLRSLKNGFKNTKLQMLLRGQNLLGYKHYSDEMVETFIRRSVSEGIDILRIFDAFNDLRNLKTAVNAAKKEGAHVQIAIAYTTGEAYTLSYWKKLAKDMESMGADSICIKDMSGLLLPFDAYELVKVLKKSVAIPIQMHSHCTSGLAPLTYIKAIEAGCDVVDTAISPFSMGTSQPATEVLVEALHGTNYSTVIDKNSLIPITDHFTKIRRDFEDQGLLDPRVLDTDTKALAYQVPGGMLSNLMSQLKQQQAEDRLLDVLKEIPQVRRELGNPPLVTPSSQIVGSQAVLNVLNNERYKMISNQTRAILKGEYGRTISPFDKDLQDKVVGDDSVITCRPADLIASELTQVDEEARPYVEKEEDLLSYLLFPGPALAYFKSREV